MIGDTKKTHNLTNEQFYKCLYELNQELKAGHAIFRLVHNFCFDCVDVVPVNTTHLEYHGVFFKLSEGYKSYLSDYFAKRGCALQFYDSENCFRLVKAGDE